MTATTAYRAATEEDIHFFRTHGYIVVRDVIDPAELDSITALCDQIIERKETLAFDWAWEKDKSRDEREFKILQSSPTMLWPDAVSGAPFRKWAVEFASALMGFELEFWYDQFLAKPPEEGARTPWHQDEAYWGRNLDERGITCWMPFHDVGVENGCMHFVPGAHLEGVRVHRPVENVQSDLLVCDVDSARVVPVPIGLGDVTFHHGKMPHMTTPNVSKRWRRALSQHFRVVGSQGEGDHYPWKIYVNQFTGERIKPPSR